MPKLASLTMIGLPLATGWSQVTESNNHQLVAAFSIFGPNAGNIGRDVSAKIKGIEFTTTIELHDFLQDLLHRLRETNNSLQLAAVLSDEQRLSFIAFNSSVLLKRNGQIGQILVSTNEVKVLEGQAKTDDLIILATSQANQFLNETKIKLQQGYDIETIITSVIPAIHSLENSSLCGIAFVRERTAAAEVEPEKKQLEINLDFKAITTRIKKVAAATINPAPVRQEKKVAPHSAANLPAPEPSPEPLPKPEPEPAPEPKAEPELIPTPTPVIEEPIIVEPEPTPEPSPPASAPAPTTKSAPAMTSTPAPSTPTPIFQPTKPPAKMLHRLDLSEQKTDESEDLKTEPVEETPSQEPIIKPAVQSPDEPPVQPPTEPTVEQPTKSTTETVIILPATLSSPIESVPSLSPSPLPKTATILTPTLLPSTTAKLNFRPWMSNFMSILAAQKPKLTKIKNALITNLKKIWPSLKNGLAVFKPIIQKIKHQDFYVSQPPSKKKVRIIVAVVTSIVVIALAVILRLSLVAKQKQAALSQLQPFLQLVEEAKQLATDNPIQAREKITVAIEEMNKVAVAYQHKKPGLKVVNQHLDEAKNFFEQISGREEFKNLQLFFDISKVAPNFIASLIDVNDDSLVLIDKETKQLIIIKLANNEHFLFDAGAFDKVKIANIQNICLNQSNLYILGNGIFQFSLAKENLTSQQPMKKIKDQDDSDRDGTYIKNFGSYLYILNPSKRNLYRYALTDGRVSNHIGWFTDKQGLEFSKIHSLAVDGDIWLTTKEGELKKYNKGRLDENFQLRGLAGPFSGEIMVYTKEELKYVYVLEPSQHRLVIFTKTGDFFREIKSASLASATQIAVSEKLNKALAVSGSLVFEIKLD